MKACEASECEAPAIARAHCQKHYRRLMKHGDANYNFRHHGPPIGERFWAKVEKTGTCWNWAGYKKDTGYGIFRANGRSLRAHRVAYELVVGQIPSGMVLDHICHNRGCVNPEHLRAVTHKQNLENLSGPQARSTSGHRGVFRQGDTTKWRVQVKHDRKLYYAGLFTSLTEAAEAARQLRLSLFTHNDLDRKSA